MAANFGKTQAWGWADGEDSWGSDVNNNFATVDRLLNNPVKGIVSDPTTITSPSNNDLYIVGESATGDFALQEGKLAYWSDVAYGGDDSWKFITAPQGQSFSMEDGSVRTYSEVSGVKYWIQSNSVIVHTWADFKYAMQSPSFATIEIGTEIVATGSDLFTVPVYKRVMGVGLAIEGTTLTLNTSQVDFFCDVTIGTGLGVAGVLTGDSAGVRFRRLTALTSSSSTTTVATQYEVLSGVVTGTVQNFWDSTGLWETEGATNSDILTQLTNPMPTACGTAQLGVLFTQSDGLKVYGAQNGNAPHTWDFGNKYGGVNFSDISGAAAITLRGGYTEVDLANNKIIDSGSNLLAPIVCMWSQVELEPRIGTSNLNLDAPIYLRRLILTQDIDILGAPLYYEKLEANGFTITGATQTNWDSTGGQVDSVVGGTNVTVDNTDPVNPIINVSAGGQVDSVVGGTDITITGTATDPIVNAPGIATNATNIATNATDIGTNATNIATNVTDIGTNATNIATNTSDIAGKLDSVVGGTNVTVTGTASDPIINATDTDTTTSESTGVLTGGVLSTGAGASEYSISDGTGQLVDGTGAITSVSWSGKSNIVPTNLATNLISWVGIDSAGNVVEQVTAFTRAQARTIIILGVVVHVNLTTVDAVNNEQHIAYNAISSTYDLAESIGFFNVEGNIFSANGANLNIDQSNGKIFKMGSNYDLAPVDNPHVRSLASLTALSFQYRFSDGSNGVTGIAIDPTTLDDGSGGTTTVPNNHFSIQRIYVFTSGNVKLQRGVASYPNLDSALAGYSSEAYVTEPSIEANGLLRGFLVVREDATDLTNLAKAVFISAPKFGEGGGSTGASASALDLQTAYNNSVTPEILTDATNGAVTIKRGSALDTDNVLEVKNGAGTTTASVTGEGEATFGGDMTLLNTKNGTWTVDESIRRLNFYSSDTSGSGVGNVGWIDTRVTNTFGTGCDMVFGTAPSGGEATESMRLSRIGDLTAIGDGTFGGTGSFVGSTNINNVLALTSATFYKKDGFNNWATGVFNTSNDFNIFLYDKTTGAYSSSFIKLTHDTNQIQLQKDTIVSGSIIQGGVTDTGEGLQGDSLRVDGDSEASSFTLSALNTAPTSATATGTTGEIRWDADYMYVCTATDTWKRSAIATW